MIQIGLVMITQIVKAINHQSMKRNRLCLRARTMIASSSIRMLEDLRQSPCCRPQRRPSRSARQRSARQDSGSNTGGRCGARPLISDSSQTTRFMLAAIATMQSHFTDDVTQAPSSALPRDASADAVTVSVGHVTARRRHRPCAMFSAPVFSAIRRCITTWHQRRDQGSWKTQLGTRGRTEYLSFPTGVAFFC
jgi:hypothetical protein